MGLSTEKAVSLLSQMFLIQFDKDEHEAIAMAIDALNESASLRARLDKAVELPCKVGDTVWLLDQNIYHRCEARVIPCIIDEFTTVRNGTYAVLNGRGVYLAIRRFRAVHINDFGKTVFLTESEAQVKLAEMKGGAE